MKKRLFLTLILLCNAIPGIAHVVKYELDRLSHGQVFSQYLWTGYRHILPDGLDHILFITCVFLMNTRLKDILIQATMFTLAHSITLGLAMYGLITPPPSVVEPLIALSIVVLALENIFFAQKKARRFATVFIFGLIHGMGFASALSGMGMPYYDFGNALFAFNVGVELGQLTVILVLYFVVLKPFVKQVWYKQRIIFPASIAIALVAGYWTIERIFFP